MKSKNIKKIFMAPSDRVRIYTSQITVHVVTSMKLSYSYTPGGYASYLHATYDESTLGRAILEPIEIVS